MYEIEPVYNQATNGLSYSPDGASPPSEQESEPEEEEPGRAELDGSVATVTSGKGP